MRRRRLSQGQNEQLKRQQDELAKFEKRTKGQRAFLKARVAGLEEAVSRRKENLQGADDAVSAAKAEEAHCIARLKAIQADLQAAVVRHNEPQGALRAPATLQAAVVRHTEPQGALRASAASRRISRATRAGAALAATHPLRAHRGAEERGRCATERCLRPREDGKKWCPRCEGRDQRKCFAGLCETLHPSRSYMV